MGTTARETKTGRRPAASTARSAGGPSRCACGGIRIGGGECAACRARRLAQERGNAATAHELSRIDVFPPDDSTREAPSAVRAVVGGGGRPLDPGVRARMEARLGHDLARVRVHDGDRAGETAHALHADAYTVGNHVVFGRGRFAPGTTAGDALLAHELVHTIQQRAVTSPLPARLAVGAPDAPEERAAAMGSGEGARAARGTPAASHPVVRRKIAVHAPGSTPAGAPKGETNEKIVANYVAALCPDFTVAGGKVEPKTAAFCPGGVAKSSAPRSCGCMCEMHALKDTWSISVNDTDWPHTDQTTRTVTVHSPFSGLEFGAWTGGKAPTRAKLPNWLVLGHELCGHALLMVRGTHPTGPPPAHGGRPSHDATVVEENAIAAEHGLKTPRGLFADPHHGESFARVTVAQFPMGSASVAALPAAERRQLDRAESFAKSASVLLDVIGHADSTGSAAANKTESSNRANSVKAELIARGVPAANFRAVRGAGSTECTSTGADPACRKVEIFLFIMEGASESHPAP